MLQNNHNPRTSPNLPEKLLNVLLDQIKGSNVNSGLNAKVKRTFTLTSILEE